LHERRKALGMVKVCGRQQTDATHVLVSIRG
jgi:hypothetical protein